MDRGLRRNATTFSAESKRLGSHTWPDEDWLEAGQNILELWMLPAY